ncbi:hypothetical protein Enr8_00080 [Blastopirellula retiformator]|uniref:Uncharacterized protein n=1 Tax=Blastopirellula retiformator TaxID=2527970 RepID=A0A5C5VI86_9BACT|nr:hypothetical protein Enr8_00080 [Blastopirellula retiformator]
MSKKRRRNSAEQIIKKLRDADAMLWRGTVRQVAHI